jgi:hypothetical protein
VVQRRSVPAPASIRRSRRRQTSRGGLVMPERPRLGLGRFAEGEVAEAGVVGAESGPETVVSSASWATSFAAVSADVSSVPSDVTALVGSSAADLVSGTPSTALAPASGSGASAGLPSPCSTGDFISTTGSSSLAFSSGSTHSFESLRRAFRSARDTLRIASDRSGTTSSGSPTIVGTNEPWTVMNESLPPWICRTSTSDVSWRARGSAHRSFPRRTSGRRTASRRHTP